MNKVFVSKWLYLLITIFFGFPVFSQNQNAMQFDGVDDEIVVPGGASLIAGAANMSITCWVYPSNAAPAYPNFDGFAGCRNDADADFYLLQVSATNVEARFKNSSGAVFTITKTCLVLNTWQHLALTYDGSKLRLFFNGNKIDSIAASGTISPTATNDFLIGNNRFQTQASFNLSGRIDETSLWNKTLSQPEISCIYHGSVDSSDVNVKLCYRFNQGVASGNNVGITFITDASGHINGVPTNMALTGTVSNFVAGSVNYTTSTIYICQGSSYNFNGTPISTGGVYLDTLPSSSGCDSVVQLTLNVLSVDTTVAQIGSTLLSNATGTYKWVDCNAGYSLIQGATSKSFTATAIGSYAVIVKQGLCVDTSACYAVTSVGINESSLSLITVHPNLIKTDCKIEFGKYFNSVKIKLFDMNGRFVKDFGTFLGVNQLLNMEEFPSAVYLLKVNIADEEKSFRIVKD